MKALYVAIEANAGSEDKIASFLTDAQQAVEAEPGTRDWYALRFDDHAFAIVDTFYDNASRLKHLMGEVGRGLVFRSFTSLSGTPGIETADIVAAKLPQLGAVPTLALHVPVETQLGQGRDVGEFLVSLKPVVEAEPGTLAWYALRLGRNNYAVLILFADEAARDAHLNGEVARLLAASEGTLLKEVSGMRRAQVLASKVSRDGGPVSAEQAVHVEEADRITTQPA